jgi:site-specific recombinase XerD
MPIAEFGEQKGISTTLPHADVDLMVDYFVNLARPHYIEASKQLEVELTKDFHQWLQETEEADRDHTIEQRQKETNNTLSSIRQALFGGG